MFTGINFSTTLAITMFFIVEYHKSKVSGCFIYLKSDGRNNLSHSNFMLQCETAKLFGNVFALKPVFLSRRFLRPLYLFSSRQPRDR